MLSDRSYMRTDYRRPTTSALVWLVAGTIAAFIIQLLLESQMAGWGEGVLDRFRLTIRSLQNWQLWTVFTHALLHQVDQPVHILATVLGLIFIGRELEPIVGSRRFVALYLGAIVSGALCWSIVHWFGTGLHIGASAGVFGLIVVFCCLYPKDKVSFLFLLILPVTLRPIHVVYGLLVAELSWLVYFEIGAVSAPVEYSASAHLGGMLAGWIYFRYIHAINGLDRPSRLDLPDWLRPWKPGRAATSGFDSGPAGESAVDLRARVDSILDKINSQGFGALTDDEKRTLDAAKDLLSRP